MAESEETDFRYNPEANYDEATMKQQRDIEEEIVASQPLIGQREDIDKLLVEFAADEIYVKKIQKLKEKYSHFRRTRGDGNCFYRAFGFAYMERLLSDKDELERFRPKAEKSKDELVSLGFPQFTIEDFHSMLIETLDKVESNCSLEELTRVFNDQSSSDYIVVFLRLLVSGHLQKESDFYSCFVEGNRTIKEFCAQEVEPMGKESDQIHIIALTANTDVPVRIEHMDRGGSSDSSLNHHDFPEGSTPRIVLLYRPGHYDILYE